MHAAVLGNLACAEALYFKGANLACEDNNGNTVLRKAAFLGKADILEMLLTKGTLHLVNKKNRFGDTPLHMAIIGGRSVACVKLLKKAGADFTIATAKGTRCTKLAQH